VVKKPTITETIRLHSLRWFGHVQIMEENRIPKKVLGMNLETVRLRGRPRNSWQDEMREDGRLVGGEKGGRKKYIIERNGRSYWERHGIDAFCTCQWNEWMNEWRSVSILTNHLPEDASRANSWNMMYIRYVLHWAMSIVIFVSYFNFVLPCITV